MKDFFKRLSAAIIIITAGTILTPAPSTAEGTSPEGASNTAASPAPAKSAADTLIIRQYRKALELDPANTKTRFQLGLALLRERRYADALTELTKISETMPDSADAYYYMGVAYAGVGELDKAFASYENVMRLSPGAAKTTYELEKAFYNLGIAHQRAAEMPKAVIAYEKSIEIAPEQTLAYCRMGEALFNLKNYPASIDKLKDCDMRSPGDAQTKRNLVSARLANGLGMVGEKKYTEALSEFRKVAEADPANESAIYFQGYLYYQLADYKQALDTLSSLRSTESPDIYNNLPSLLQNIAAELQSREDWDTAAKALHQAIALKKDDPDLHYLLGYNLMKKDDYEGALKEIKEALRFNPAHGSSTLALAVITERTVESHVAKGEAAFIKGDYTVAADEYNEALALDPANSRALKGKGDTEEKLTVMHTEAATKLEREIRDGLIAAENYMRDENYKEALTRYRYILAFDPQNPTALQGAAGAEGFIKNNTSKHIQMGDAFAITKKDNLAIKEYKTALSYAPDDTLAKSKLSEAQFRLASVINPFLDDAAENEKNEYLDAAIKDYEEALTYDPENKTALEGKQRAVNDLDVKFKERLANGKKFLLDRDYIKAAENLRMALRLRPDDVEAKEGLAKADEWLAKTISSKLKTADKSLSNGNYPDAAAAYAEVIEIDPKNLSAQEGLQNIKRQVTDEISKKIAAAEEAYHQGQYYRAYIGYGEALQLDKDNGTARAMRLQSRQKLDEITAPILKRAIEASSKGDGDSALIDFKKVLNADPSNETAKKYLGSIDKSKAMKSIGAKVEKLYLKGIDLYTSGKYTDAIKTWEEVLELDPNYEKAARNIKKAKRKLEGVMDVK